MQRVLLLLVALAMLVPATTSAQAPIPGATDAPAETADAVPGGLPIQYNSLYASAESNLWQINPATGAATYVGHIGYQGTDIAFDGNTLYGISFSELLEIDPVQGTGRRIGYTGYGNMNALAVALDGSMYAGCTDGAFLKIDKHTGVAQRIGYYGYGLSSSGDLAFRDDGTLFASVNWQGSLNSWLAVVDRYKGTATLLGDIGYRNVYGLSFHEGKLYGASAGGDVLQIDQLSGMGRRISSIAAPFWGLSTSGPALTGSITSPADGTSMGAGNLQIDATASYAGGPGVKEVVFQLEFGGQWWQLAVDNTAPYQAAWQVPADLPSQQVRLRIDVVGKDGKRTDFAGGTRRVNIIQSIGNPGVAENWVPSRAYLNQRSLSPQGDEKCSVTSMAMVLAMIGRTTQDYQTMATKANEMWPRVLIDGTAYVYKMAQELTRQGAISKWTQPADADAAWQAIRAEIDAGRPLIVRPSQRIQTPAGHYIVAVGYQEQAGTRQLITYDPFGRWVGQTCAELGVGCPNNYDRNGKEAISRKGQWVYYNFAKLTDPWDMYLITARNPAAAAGVALAPDGIPSTAPDNMSSEPVNIGTFRGGAEPYELYLPLVVRLPEIVAPLPTATPTASPVSPGRELSALSASSPPSIDGDLIDWAGAAAESLDAARSEKTGGTQPAPTPQDLSLSLSSAWDPAHLYVSALITDDALIRGESGPIWEDDTLELGIQSGGYTRQFSLGPDGRRQALRDGSAAPSPNVIMTVRSVAGGWKLELAIPVAELGLASLRAGDQFPFTFGYWDDDDGGAGDSHLIRWGTSTNSASATWGVLRLSGNWLPPARPTATPPPPARASLPASRFPLPPVLDGGLGDWSLVPATTLDDARAESHGGKLPHPAPSDLSLALHAGWDSRQLYFAVAVTDDIVVENESAQVWEDDAVELGIQIGGRVRQFSFAADGRYSELIDGSQRVTPALSHKTLKTPGGWILEVAIPASEVDIAAFTENAGFPFTFGYWDDDDLGGGDSHLILWGTSTNSRPEQWRPLTLTAVPAF